MGPRFLKVGSGVGPKVREIGGAKRGHLCMLCVLISIVSRASCGGFCMAAQKLCSDRYDLGDWVQVINAG